MTDESGQTAVAERPAAEIGREFELLDWLLLGALLLLAMVVAYLTAMAIWRFGAGSFLLGLVKYSLLVLANLAVGALGSGLWIEWKRPRRSKFGKREDDGIHRVRKAKLVIGTIAVAALLGFEFWALVSLIPADLISDVLPAIGCLLIGAALCFPWSAGHRKLRLALWPNRVSGDTRPWLGVRLFLAPLIGVMVGVIVSASWYLGNAYYSNHESPSAALPTYVITINGGYLALGDSYSAGEGLEPFQGKTPGISPDTNLDNCHRSTAQAYSEVLPLQSGGQRLNLGGSSSNASFRACSGAVIRDIFAKRRGSPYVQPQVDLGVIPAQPALVTITIGGNDALFSKIVGNCFLGADCLSEHFPPSVPPLPPAGPPHYLSYRPYAGPLDTWAPQMITVVGENELTLFKALRADFPPPTRIIVLGYPYLFPPPSRTAGMWPTFCNSFLRRYSPTLRQTVRGWEDQFNARIYEAAAIAGIEFVSPATAMAGHEPCGVAGQFLNSVKPALNFPVPLDGGSFHPNQSGQRVYAALLDCYLHAYPQPPSYLVPGSALPSDLPAALQWPFRLGLQAPPGWRSALPGCGGW